MADNSQGMEIHDLGDPESRGAQLKDIIKELKQDNDRY